MTHPALLLALLAPSAMAADTVQLCHQTSSATNPYNVIQVSARAQAAHVAHGDWLVSAEVPGNGVDDDCDPSTSDELTTSCTDITGTWTRTELSGGAVDCVEVVGDTCGATLYASDGDSLSGDDTAITLSDGGSAVCEGSYDALTDTLSFSCSDGSLSLWTVDAGECSDDDQDGVTPAEGDCDDGDANVSPYADEICANGVDDNCDSRTDEVSGEAYWNDLSAFANLSSGGTAEFDVAGSPVSFTYSADSAANYARLYAPPSTLNGSFTTPWGSTVGWTGTMPYVDLISPTGSVNGTLTWEFEGTAEEVFGPGWLWVVAPSGTSGDVYEGPTTSTSSEPLEALGQFDSFATGLFATQPDAYTILGSLNTSGGWHPDGYSFFTLPADAQTLVIDVDDGGRYDPHGYIVGAVSVSECVLP